MSEQKINRRQFIGKSGNFLMTTAGVTLFASLLASCGKDDNPVSPNGSGNPSEDFVAVKLSENTSLQQVGGFVTLQVSSVPVILFRVSESSFKALSLVCTHQGCTVSWQASNNKFDCPCHGSQFDKDGKVLQGPATTSLPTYETEFDSDNGQVKIFY